MIEQRDPQPLPLVCTLPAGEAVDRAAAWRALARHAVDRAQTVGCVSTTYPASPGLASTVRWLISAETECCSFLRFVVREADDALIVDIGYPEAFEPVISSVFSPPAVRGADAGAQASSAAGERDIRYAEMPIGAVRAYSEDTALMFEWLERDGYDVDIGALRKTSPEVERQTFGEWAGTRDWSPPVTRSRVVPPR